MIARSRLVFWAAFTCATGMHLVGIVELYERPTVEIAASGAPVEVKQGNAFADLATGVITAISPSQTTPTPQVQNQRSQAQPLAATMPTSPKQAVAIQPGTTAVVSSAPMSSPARPVVSQVPTLTAAQPIVAARTVVADEHDTSSVLTSARPTARPRDLVPPVQERQPSKPRGNARQIATAGSQTSSNTRATAASSGSNAQAAPAPRANAQAVSNYPGQILRRISRVRKPRTRVPGAAVVSFSIASSGGLGSVSVARSSGNAQLDQMAITVVQRAAPFPAPPAGAQTRYTIEVTGR